MNLTPNHAVNSDFPIMEFFLKDNICLQKVPSEIVKFEKVKQKDI